MADEGTLATTAQVLLAIGSGASATQILEANTNIWILMAESDIERAFGDNVEVVDNYATVTPALKQWLSGIASERAAWRAINQNQNNWSLSATQSKLNILDATWTGFLADLKANKADILADLNLT